jgi:hypothetical protein
MLSAQQVRELLAERSSPEGVALPDRLELDPGSYYNSDPIIADNSSSSGFVVGPC